MKSKKISNMTDMRNYLIETIEALRNRDIELNEALGIGKLIDTTLDTVKMQVDYSKFLGIQEKISFMQHSNVIEGETEQRKLE